MDRRGLAIGGARLDQHLELDRRPQGAHREQALAAIRSA